LILSVFKRGQGRGQGNKGTRKEDLERGKTCGTRGKKKKPQVLHGQLPPRFIYRDSIGIIV
jgi:hypothetical protein